MSTKSLECVCRISGMVAFATLGAFGGSAETVALRAFETGRTHVTETATLDRATLGGSATLVKDGVGTLNVNLSKVTAPASAMLAIAEGSVTATAGEERPMETGLTPPASAVAKLGLWLDASLHATRPELFPGANSNDSVYVDRWLDAREENPSAPTRYYAHANFTTNWSGVSTEYVLFGGRTPSVWFGGYESGRQMSIVKNGAAMSVKNVVHLFAVHVIDDSFGFIFGNAMHIGGFMNKSSTLTNPWWYSVGGGEARMYTGNFYVNGVLTDGQTESPQKGLQMMEYDFGTKAAALSQIFRDGNNFASSTGYRAGGGYLCEVMFFTNRLTAAEAAAVGGYLACKWGIDTGVAPTLAAAPGSALTLASAGTNVQDVAFAGSGTVSKAGAETLYLRGDASSFAGQLRVEEGAVDMAVAVPLAVRAGDRVTATSTTKGPLVSVTPNAVPDTRVVKDGDETVHLTSLPAAITRLDVKGGAVHFDAPNTNAFLAAGEYPEVAIANASFEEWGGDETAWGRKVTDSGVDGWAASSSVYEIDYENWSWTGAGLEGAKRSTWCFGSLPPDGKRAVVLRNRTSSIRTPVTIPVAGDYELTLYVSGRENTSNFGFQLDVSLASTDSLTPLYDFGRILFCWNSGYERIRLRARNVKAGSYLLYFKGASPRGDTSILLDDLHLRRVPAEREAVWRIPNGDFERAEFYDAKAVIGMTNTTVDGWTFVPPDGYAQSETKPLVGPTSYYLGWNNSGEYFLGNLPGDASFVQLYFRCGDYPNGRAETTFTPPAGTWYVRADVGRYQANKAELKAIAKIGDDVVQDLGSKTILAHKLKPTCWAKPITVDGTQSVTLSLVFTGEAKSGNATPPGCMVDNVVLSRRNSEELIANGSFEGADALAGWTEAVNNTENKWYQNLYDTPNASQRKAFVSDRPPEGGRTQMVVINRGVLTQPVVFGDDGWYEVSWWSHRRRDRWFEPAIRAWIAWTDTSGKACTNVIGEAVSSCTNFVRQAFLFRPPAAGAYTFGIQGVNTTGKADPASENLVDCVSVKAADFRSDDFPLNDQLEIKVAAGARLHLGYTGTNVIKHLSLGGHGKGGVISAETDPDFITGPGALVSELKGILILVR